MRTALYLALTIAFLSISTSVRPQSHAADTQAQTDTLHLEDAASFNLTARKFALAALSQRVLSDPRGAAAELSRNRLLDSVLDVGENDTVAEIALLCAVGHPDRIDRVDFFMNMRIKALHAAGRFVEELVAAKGYYNVCNIRDTRKAIYQFAQALDAAHPDQPALAKRFKLQQLAWASPEDKPSATRPATDADPDVLENVKVDAALYPNTGLAGVRNRDWRTIAQGNLFLLQDKPSDAMNAFRSKKESSNEEVRDAANQGIARATKALTHHIAAANLMLVQPEVDEQP